MVRTVNNMKSWDSSPLSTIYLYPIFARVEEKAELSNKRPRHQTPSTLLHLSQQMRSWARQNNQWLTSAILPRRPIMFLSSSIVSGKASLHCRNTLAENFVSSCGGECAHFVTLTKIFMNELGTSMPFLSKKRSLLAGVSSVTFHITDQAVFITCTIRLN